MSKSDPSALQAIKKRAKQRSKESGIPHHVALEIEAEASGFIDFRDARERLKKRLDTLSIHAVIQPQRKHLE